MKADLLPILVIGAGGHAWSCIDLILSLNKYRILGLIASKSEVGNEILGHKVIGTDSELAFFKSETLLVVNAIGQIKSVEPRKKLFYQLKELGFHLPVIVSLRAYVSPYAEIGEGTLVFHNSLINAGANIGKNCIVNTGAIIEHNVRVSDHCHISTGVILNGSVEVGEESFVGSGSKVQENTLISSSSVIPMGSLFFKSGAFKSK